MKKLYFTITTLFITLMSFGQVTIFSAGGGGAFPTGWTGINNVTANNIDRGSYYLVDAGDPSDIIETDVYDLSTYGSAEISLDVASFGGGSHNQVKIEISFDGGTTYTQIDLSAATTGSSYIDGGTFSLSSITSQVKIRISNNGISGRGVRLRNIELIAASSDPTISVSEAITGLNYFAGFGPSNEGTFTVSGTNLTADITVNAPSDFEISEISGGPFSSSITLNQSSGEVASTTLYTRLQLGLIAMGYSGDIIASSTGASDQTVALSGTVSPATPLITITGSGISGLNYNEGEGPSAEDSFSVEGVFLTNDITVTAPTDFEVSLTSGSGFASAVSVSEVGGTVATTTIYTRLVAGTAGSYSGDITATSTGAVDKIITVEGTVFGSLTNALVITGVYDGPLSGGNPKGIELYVIENIADLSIFGLGSANNGGGTDGVEFTFPSDAATAGSYIYISSSSTGFNDFFGFDEDYVNGSMGVNGDDAIELFENGNVIDVFGDIDCDPNSSGTACPEWEYLDGWAYRNTEGPNTVFTFSEWDYSGVNQLEGGSTNATTDVPFPAATYYNEVLSVNNSELEGFVIYPNPVINGSFEIRSTTNTVKTIEIYNMLGKQVYSKEITSNRVNISDLNSGIYIIRVEEEGKIATRKLVIE